MIPVMEIARYTQAEEVANSVTHGVGTALSVAGLCVLVTFAVLGGDPWRVVSFSVYGGTLVLLYLISTLYHGFRSPNLKSVFHVLDHAAIYLLIAGTYTPFALVNLRGGWGWTLFGITWGLAAAGVVFKLLWFGRFKLLSLAIYLAMGWFVVIAIKPILVHVPLGGLIWLLLGGCAYTFGVAFYVWRKLPYHHAIWHVFVIGGSVCHFFSMLFYVLPG
jgi:hemolysin III